MTKFFPTNCPTIDGSDLAFWIEWQMSGERDRGKWERNWLESYMNLNINSRQKSTHRWYKFPSCIASPFSTSITIIIGRPWSNFRCDFRQFFFIFIAIVRIYFVVCCLNVNTINMCVCFSSTITHSKQCILWGYVVMSCHSSWVRERFLTDKLDKRQQIEKRRLTHNTLTILYVAIAFYYLCIKIGLYTRFHCFCCAM